MTRHRAGVAARIGAACLATLLPAIGATTALAQTATQTGPENSFLVVPTVKLLAIGSFTAKATPELWKPILPSEVRATALLYFAGRIDQWYVKQDQNGVVFVINGTDPTEARDLLDRLPLGKAGLMEFQIIPLGPLSPLRLLLSDQSK